jgi:hypothetical protein
LASCLSIATGFAQSPEPLPARAQHRAEHYNKGIVFDHSVRIVAKWRDDSGIRAEDGVLVHDPALMDNARFARYGVSQSTLSRELAQANRLLREYRLSFDPLIDADETDLATQRQTAERYWSHEVAELASYTQIVLADGGMDRRYRDLVDRLNRLTIVEVAYLEPIATPFIDKISTPEPPLYSCDGEQAPDDLGLLTGYQGYLWNPPAGINAIALHYLPGGNGSGVKVIDIEGGRYPHADLPKPFLVTGENYSQYAGHGTAVLGIIASLDNLTGTTGIASGAEIGFRGIYNSNIHDDWAMANTDTANVASNIYWAGKHSQKGVVLIELQRPGPIQEACECNGGNKCTASPVEYWPAEFDSIQTAVGNGATVVEAAGNGARSLDHPVLNGAFDRDVRDSGAILTTGSRSDGLTPICSYGGPNYGTRIDVHAWGENVMTTGSQKPYGKPLFYDAPGTCYDYTDGFNGSSSASAIIAGATTALQGLHRAAFGESMDPYALRKLLVSSGIPQIEGAENHPIGTHPDLLEAAKELGAY